MARFLLDTNICIYIRQKRPAAALTRFESLEPGDVAMSVISYGELARGVEKSQNRASSLLTLQELVSVIPVLPLPMQAGAICGAFRAELERTGVVIGNNDLWIAAHAKAADLVLVTNNEREFARITGLRIENWAQA